MFNFKSLTTILKYDWTKIIADLAPKGNETLMEKKDHDNVVTGVIFVAIGKLFFYLLSIPVLNLISNGIVDADKVFGFDIRGTFQTDFLIFALPVILILCEYITYKNKQNSYLQLVLSGWCLCSFAYCLYLILVWIYLIFKTFLVPFGGLIGTLIEILGYIFILTGYLEFARKNKKQYVEDNRPPEKVSLIKTSAIGLDDIAMHTKRKCKKCNSDLENDYKFCIECGTKIE